MTTSSEMDKKHYLLWLEELLQEGKQVNVRVNGMSMFPWILPKNVVCAKPVEKQLLATGCVILFQGETGWVAHRLISIDNKSNCFITRGDANLHKDLPLKYEDIKGIVIGVTQSKFFLSDWAVSKNAQFLARISWLTAPLFWMMGRVAVWIWKWVKKIRGVKQ